MTSASDTQPPYDRAVILNENGPFNPSFMDEAVRTLMRTMPLDDTEPKGWQDRRMNAALLAMTALHPRDEIEVMYGVQALAAYHAAAACWRLGMNLQRPCGNSIRHFATAASSARAFDSMIRAIERRQAKPLSVPQGRPEPQAWDTAPDPAQEPAQVMRHWEGRCLREQVGPQPPPADLPDIEWTPEALALAEDLLKKARTDKENEGLDIANTEGILPGGGMIVMDDPTQNQMLYMGRRLALMYRREYDENLRKGINKYPRIRGIKTGDLIP